MSRQSLAFRRYFMGWLLLIGACLLMCTVLAKWVLAPLPSEAIVGPSVSMQSSMVLGMLTIAFTDVVVYCLVARGLVKANDEFVVCWGISVLFKFMTYGITGTVFIGERWVAMRPFLLSMVAAFVVFTLHQVCRLVQLSDAQDAQGH